MPNQLLKPAPLPPATANADPEHLILETTTITSIRTLTDPTADRPVQTYDTTNLRIPFGTRLVLQQINGLAEEYNESFNEAHTALLIAGMSTGEWINWDNVASEVNDCLGKLDHVLSYRFRNMDEGLYAVGEVWAPPAVSLLLTRLPKVLSEHPHSTLQVLTQTLQSRLRSLTKKKKVQWPDLVRTLSSASSVTSALALMRTYASAASSSDTVESRFNGYLDAVRIGKIRADELQNAEVDALQRELVRELKRATDELVKQQASQAYPQWGFWAIDLLAREVDLGQNDADVTALRRWTEDQKAEWEEKERVKEEENVKKAAEYAVERAQETAAMEERMRMLWKEPYTGGSVVLDSGERWLYAADGRHLLATFSSPLFTNEKIELE
ncbi:hypothetical protein HDV00_008080 [Rhizophlyctis rosea]|nr:hypothetical protein HDV00_008080 [Rhizophlyctis rosea]